MKISLPTKLDKPFVVWRSSFFSNLVSNINGKKRTETGNLYFDKKYFLGTNHPDIAASLFSQEASVIAVDKIFSPDFDTLFVNDGVSVGFKWQKFKFKKALNTEVLK